MAAREIRRRNGERLLAVADRRVIVLHQLDGGRGRGRGRGDVRGDGKEVGEGKGGCRLRREDVRLSLLLFLLRVDRVERRGRG